MLNSYLSREKKDCISVANKNWRVLEQYRLILRNLKELYVECKAQHKYLKIGLSKFCLLRLRKCIYDQNIKLMFDALCNHYTIKIHLYHHY